MQTIKVATLSLIAALAVSSTASAQGKGRGNGGVPPGHRPPPGMCRVWIDGVPPGHQPAPTDCSTAIATRPANARVIYGDDARRSGRRDGEWERDDRVIYDRRGDVRDRDRRDGDIYDRRRDDGRSDDPFGIFRPDRLPVPRLDAYGRRIDGSRVLTREELEARAKVKAKGKNKGKGKSGKGRG